jgi:hypothetical protein
MDASNFVNILNLVGAWAFPMVGAEQDAHNSGINSLTRSLGMISIIVSLVFIGMATYYFIKVTAITGKTENRSRPVDDSGKPIPDNKLYKDSLSPEGKKLYDQVQGMVMSSYIMGIIVLAFALGINEGFIPGNRGWITVFLLIFGWGSAAITMAYIIKNFIIDIPKIKSADKDTNERYEDDKYLDLLSANKVTGIIMIIMYLIPTLGNFVTEFNERASAQQISERLMRGDDN